MADRIGNKPFDELGLTVTKVTIPLLPQTRQSSEEIPGKDGEIDLQTDYGARQIEITCQLYADNEIEYHHKLSAIAAAFSPTKQKELVLERLGGKRYMVKYNGTIPIDRVATLGEFTIPLKAFNPFAESVIDSTETLDLGDGMSLGTGYALDDGPTTYNATSSPTTFVVDHNGNADCYPVVTVTGTGGNMVITNDTTEEALSFSGSLTSGDELVIDCNGKTIELNGSNVFADFSGDFFKLTEGDNAFTVTADTPDLTIEFSFRHTYLY